MIHSIVHRMFRQNRLMASVLLTTLFMAGTVEAAEFVQVIHGPDAAPLEKLAASELADILGRVFDDVEIRSGSVVARRAGTILFVGNPDTNPGIACNNFEWPKVTNQGIAIVSKNGQKLHAVGGGSPAATLWAAYELGHRLGIRYLLRGDIDPLNKRPFDLSGIEFTIEPQVRQRGWETIGSGAFSFESWSLTDHQRLIRQLAKLKFNHLILKIEPWHPFVSYKFKGIARSSAAFFQDKQYSLTGDFAGKKAFGGARIFQQPDFTQEDTPAELFAAGRRYLAALIEAAGQYGMTVSVQFRRAVFPAEFSKVLPGSKIPETIQPLCLAADYYGNPGKDSQELFATAMNTCFETYPEITSVSWPGTDVKFRRFNIVSVTNRKSAKERLPNLQHDRSLGGVQKVMPKAVDNSRLSLAVHSPSLQLLPHTHGVEVWLTLSDAVREGWTSISIGPSMVAEFDQDVVYVSQAMWTPDLHPGVSHKRLWTTATGNAAAAERLWQARTKLENASRTIMYKDPHFASLGPFGTSLFSSSVLMRHYRNRPVPDWWQQATDDYTQYMIELYRAHGAIDGDAKPVLFYYAKRGEFVLEYLGAVKAVREAALAKSAGNTEEAIEHLELALELTYNCINTLSDVARDQSDRGLIAVLNAYAYRPLVAELERLSEEE